MTAFVPCLKSLLNAQMSLFDRLTIKRTDMPPFA
jgi:hypothetical protein